MELDSTQAPINPAFSIFSGMLQATEEDGHKILRTTATSACELMDGNEISEDCVRDMVAQAQEPGMTIFLNHSYEIPEDVMGTMTASRLVMRANKFGLPVADMDMDIRINEANPRAMQTYNSIVNGTKIGVSIGADIVDWEYKSPKLKLDGGIRFKRLRLRETSLVGLPRNPRSWVQSAAMAVHSALAPAWTPNEEPLDEPDEVHAELPDAAFASVDESGRHYPHHYADGSINIKLLRNALVRIADSDNPQAGRGHLERHARELGIEDRKEHSMPITATAAAPTVEVVAEEPIAAPEGTEDPVTKESETEQVESLTASAEPASVTDEVLPVASEVGDEPQETNEQSTESESIEGVLNAAAELDLTGKDAVVLDLVLSTLERAVSDLTATKSELAVKNSEVASLKADRDQAKADLEEAYGFVERLARLPLGRKATFAAPVESFKQRFGGIYEENFLKLIEERETDG